eukprot:765127-Hanusia_phi.AAC.3
MLHSNVREPIVCEFAEAERPPPHEDAVERGPVPYLRVDPSKVFKVQLRKLESPASGGARGTGGPYLVVVVSGSIDVGQGDEEELYSEDQADDEDRVHHQVQPFPSTTVSPPLSSAALGTMGSSKTCRAGPAIRARLGRS